MKQLKFLKKFDKFGKEANLYYEGNEKRTSWIGFILSIIYVFLYFSFFLYKLIRMLNKVDVSVYDTFPYFEKPPSINLTNNNFYVGFGLEHPETYDNIIDKTIYYVKAFFKEGKRKGGKWEWEIKDVDIEKCKIENFGESFREKFQNNSLDNLYCLKDINKTLYGHFSYDIYSLFFIQLFPCKNTTENNNHCKPREIIDEYLNGTYFCMEFEDVELTPQNFSTPVRPRNQDVYFTVGKKLFQEVHIFFQIVNVETDEDIFGLNLEKINYMRKDEYLKYHSAYYMNNYMEEDIYEKEIPFCNITIKLHDQIRIQRRTYPKLITIWGDIGGFMEFIFIVLNLFSFLPIHISYEKEIVNKLFKFDLGKNLIYVKKFEKSKIPIDFLELYKNEQFYNTNIYEDKIFDDKMKNMNDNIIFNDKIENRINKTGIYEENNIKKFDDITENEINNTFIDNDTIKNINNNNIGEINNTNNNSDSKNKIKKLGKNKFYSKSYHNAFSSDNLMNIILKENKNNYGEKYIIDKIKMDSFYIYLCFCCSRKFKNRNNFLIDKGMEIFTDKMNIFTIFKKSINNEIILNKEPIVEKLDIPLTLKKNN